MGRGTPLRALTPFAPLPIPVLCPPTSPAAYLTFLRGVAREMKASYRGEGGGDGEDGVAGGLSAGGTDKAAAKTDSLRGSGEEGAAASRQDCCCNPLYSAYSQVELCVCYRCHSHPDRNVLSTTREWKTGQPPCWGLPHVCH